MRQACNCQSQSLGFRVLGIGDKACRISVAELIKWSGKLPGEEVRGVERSRLRIVKLGLLREKAHRDTIKRPYG